MKSEAMQLLKNLLARVRGETQSHGPVVQDTKPMNRLVEDITPPGSAFADKLNTNALRFTESPVPGWTLCLDFGTAKSKAFAATNGEPPEFAPLPLGKADEDLDGSVHEVVSSIWIDDGGLIFMGSEAVKRSSRHRQSTNRRRLDSLKQELSPVRGDAGPERLERPLPKEVDPTSTLTYLDAVTVYLAYLTDLATTELERDSRIRNRYTRRRFTLPWWEKGHRQWVGELVTKSLGRAQVLADTFHNAWRDGIRVDRIKRLVQDAVACDARLDWLVESETRDGVLEALAAGSARLWKDRDARELMFVVDIGAGTTDLSLFLVRQKKGVFDRAWPVEPCGDAIEQAGNSLDGLLVEALMRKANLGEDPDLKRRVSHGLWSGSVRQLKERLFETGEITETLVSDHTVTLSKEEFLDLPGIKAFESTIGGTIQKLFDQVHESWGAAAKIGGVTLVLTGGGCRLPMIRSLADRPWTIGKRAVRFQLAKDVPDGVAGAEFRREYPKLAVAMGGALPIRLDERVTLKKFFGDAPAVGPIETYPTRGI